VLGDGVNDVDLRHDWRARRGLCAQHWRVWRGLEAPALSSSVLLRDLLDTELQRDAPAPRRRWWRRHAAPVADVPTVRCPACELEATAQARYLDALTRLPADRLAEALAHGRGFVCLQHLHGLPPGQVREQLIDRLAGLVEELDTFIRRSDHRFAHEPMGSAGDAWLRAIRAFGGDV
jgi:hypothetical protein